MFPPVGEPQNIAPPKPSPADDSAEKGSGASSYAERKELQKAIRKAEKTVKDSEKKITDMEQRIKELDTLLCQPDHASDMVLITEYTDIKKALDQENDRWMEASEQLEELQSKL